MTAFAGVSDVEARWRPLSSADQVVAATLLEDASDMARERWPDLDARIAAGTLNVSTVVRVLSGVVRRALIKRGSDGVETHQQTAGPFSDSVKYVNPNGNLYFSADDIRTLDPGAHYPSKSKVGWLL